MELTLSFQFLTTEAELQWLKIKNLNNIMINKNKKGRGKRNYGHPTAIVLRKVAGVGVIMGVLAVGFLWGARGAEAVR